MLVTVCSGSSQSQFTARTLPAYKAESHPVIDGKLDDALWQTAPKASAFIDTLTSKPTAEQTEAWLAYDSKYIYVAFYCHDTRPDHIVARVTQDNSSLGSDDNVVFSIGPFFTGIGTTSSFAVNSIGSKRDYLDGGRAGKTEWRGVWKANAVRVADGWTAEMQIPWAMLDYPQHKKAIKMAINFGRYHARPQIGSAWSDLTRSYRPEFNGIWVAVEHPEGRTRKALNVMTYGTTEIAEHQHGLDPRAGVDIRYTPSQQSNSVLTLFPDLKNVQQSVAGIAFTRSERYLGESRPFFQEGSSYFPYEFYSRRIDDFNLGLRTFGKLDSHLSYGLMGITHDDREAAAVSRVGYNFGQYGDADIFAIVGRGGRPQNEQVGFHLSGQRKHWSMNSNFDHARTGSSGGSNYNISSNFNDARWNFTLGYSGTDPDYSPALGYVGFTDQRSYAVGAGYGDQYRTGPLRDINVFSSYRYSTHYDSALFQKYASFGVYATTRSNYSLNIGRYEGEFEHARDATWSAGLSGNTNNRYRNWGIDYNWGTTNDHDSQFLSFSVRNRFLKKLDVSLAGNVRRDEERRHQYIGTIGWEFDKHQALTGRLVETDGKLNWYMSYRNADRVGHEVFVIVGDPNSDRFTSRLAVKWVWAK